MGKEGKGQEQGQGTGSGRQEPLPSPRPVVPGSFPNNLSPDLERHGWRMDGGVCVPLPFPIDLPLPQGFLPLIIDLWFVCDSYSHLEPVPLPPHDITILWFFFLLPFITSPWCEHYSPWGQGQAFSFGLRLVDMGGHSDLPSSLPHRAWTSPPPATCLAGMPTRPSFSVFVPWLTCSDLAFSSSRLLFPGLGCSDCSFTTLPCCIPTQNLLPPDSPCEPLPLCFWHEKDTWVWAGPTLEITRCLVTDIYV